MVLVLMMLITLGPGLTEGRLAFQEARAVTNQTFFAEQTSVQQRFPAYPFEDLECGYKVAVPSGWQMLGRYRDDSGIWTDFYQQDEHAQVVPTSLQAMIRIGCGTKVNQEGFWDSANSERLFNHLLQSEIESQRTGDPRYTIRKLKQTAVDSVIAVIQLEEARLDAQTELTYAISAYMWREGRIYKVSVTFLDQSLWRTYGDVIDNILANLQFVPASMKPTSPLTPAADYGFLDTLKLPWL
jgi:hypothetical protein